ncbi:5' nucleotidase, NT5C type [Neobacillus dielmonensis]|uniref:5' nucleotidase, NT5C type n=1 Tax=Neobacillus dielmonensis TaxID=1347369 RepID=UPI0005AB6BE9|nr:nucleotidase [Neobacillus dielmonensis]
MKKRFGIDIDGTVTCPTSMIPFINKAFNLKLTYEEIDEYDLTPFVNVPEDVFAKWFVANEPIIYEGSPLAAGAEAVLNSWKQEFELFFISARGPHLRNVTEKWFQHHGITYDHIELIGSHDKIEAVKKYKVDMFFEDKHDNAVMIHESCHIPVILFNTPYNQDPLPDGVIRVNNWREAEQWVNKQMTFQSLGL